MQKHRRMEAKSALVPSHQTPSKTLPTWNL